MSDPNTLQHPTSMSEADKAALIASDPAAFDDDASSGAEGGDAGDGSDAGAGAGSDVGTADGGAAAGEGGSEAGEGAGAAGAEGADAGAAAGAESEGDAAGAGADSGDGAAAGEGTEPKIPKARLDEVIDQRNAAEQLARRQAIELQTLREQLAATKPPKDFKAEFSALLKQYDEGEIDQADYEQRKYDLQREEFEHIAGVKALQTQAHTAEQAVQRTWEEEVAHWSAQNKGFFEVEGNAAVMQRALASVVAFHGEDISDAELLAEASKLAFAKTGYKPPAAPPAAAAPAGDPQPDPTKPRRQQNAQRAADASNAPPAISGGVGGRGGPERSVDLENLKPGSFSKVLSKAEQEKLLGEGAV